MIIGLCIQPLFTCQNWRIWTLGFWIQIVTSSTTNVSNKICQDKSRQKSQLSIIQCLGQPIITDESPPETWFLLIWDFIESVKTMWSLKIFSVKAQILLVKTQDPLFASCFNWLCREPGWSFWGPLVRVEWGLDKHIYILPRAWIYLN